MVCCSPTAVCAASLGSSGSTTACPRLRRTRLADTQRCWCKGMFWGAVTVKWPSSKHRNNSVALSLLLVNAGQQHRSMTMHRLSTPLLLQSARCVGYSYPDPVWSPTPVCCSLPLRLTGLGEDQLPPSPQSGASAELPTSRQSLSPDPRLPRLPDSP